MQGAAERVGGLHDGLVADGQPDEFKWSGQSITFRSVAGGVSWSKVSQSVQIWSVPGADAVEATHQGEREHMVDGDVIALAQGVTADQAAAVLETGRGLDNAGYRAAAGVCP